VAGLTAVALAVRLTGLGQSIFGDEFLLLTRVDDRSLGGMLREVHDTESTPPFHFLLAWVGTKLAADPVSGIRLPSVLLGTATVAVTYLVGLRSVGRNAGLVGAAIVALSPFAIFYGTEGRAYATLAFLVALSMLGLVRAVDTGRRPWWVLWAVSACLVLYTHYTGIYVLIAQAAWAFAAYPRSRRALVAAGGAAALAYLPWLPSFFVQSDDNASNRIDSFAPLSVQSYFRDVLKFLDGHPFIPLRELPGRLALAVFCAAVLAAGVASVARLVRERSAREGEERLRMVLLVAAVALATPAGLLLYSAVAKSIVLPRNMSASLPGAALIMGWALTTAGRRPAAVATAAAMIALCAGTVQVLDKSNQRPPFEQAAEYIDARGRSGDGVIDFFYNPASKASGRELVDNLEGSYGLFRAGEDDDGAWRRAEANGSRVFLVVPQIGPLRGVPRRSGPGRRFPLRAYRIFDGWIPLGVFEYTR